MCCQESRVVQSPSSLAQARQCQQMWPRSGPKPVTALVQSESRITRQSGSWPMRGGICDVKSINGSVRAVRVGRRGQRDHNIASRGRPSLADPGVHSDTVQLLPRNTSWRGLESFVKMSDVRENSTVIVNHKHPWCEDTKVFKWPVLGKCIFMSINWMLKKIIKWVCSIVSEIKHMILWLSDYYSSNDKSVNIYGMV